MVDELEEGVAGLGAHAVGDVALDHDPVARRRPRDGGRHLPGSLDLVDDLGRDAEVLQAPAGALVADAGKVLRGGRVHLRREQAEEWLALMHVVAGGDGLDLLDEGVGTHRDDRDPALVLLDGAGRAHRHRQDPSLDDCRPDPGALELAGRDPHGAVVGVLAPVDGKVVHPHRIFLRNRRGVRQTHRVAVEAHLSGTCRRHRGLTHGHVAVPGVGHRLGLVGFVEAHVLACVDGAIVSTVRCALGLGGVVRLPVRVPVVDHGTGRLGRDPSGHSGPCLGTRQPVDEPGPRLLDERRHGAALMPRAIPQNPRRERGEGPGQPCSPAHLVALNTSLFSTVPVSPWTLAPSERRQLPAIVSFTLNR
ncbi:hypothetical protein CFIICLFH_0900 [Methylobacterium goesingense]|nr:hypothetical protein CFIICLFH_0900 [Methylobacterium goesingense]